VPPEAGVIETTVPWCFLYGEKDWISNKHFQNVEYAADPYDEDGDAKDQVGVLKCTIE
jgi:hypothetical protein